MRRAAIGGRRGFSLVELAIVIAITGILAAIAVPNLLEMQLKAKRAELPVNVTAIKQAEVSYDATFDEYLELPINPREDDRLDKFAVAWDAAEEHWLRAGFAPDGLVRGNYQVGLSSADHPGEPFLVTGRTDVDGDDALAEYTATDGQNAVQTPARARLY